MLKGSCLCKDITVEVKTCKRGPTEACHCGQCRKNSGHFWACVELPSEAVTITGTPEWYQSSPDGARGFCKRCGSFLFWREPGSDRINISLGIFDGPTGLTIDRHIFMADKGDYYDIADGVPQFDQFGDGADA